MSSLTDMFVFLQEVTSGSNKLGVKRNVRLLKVNYIKEFRFWGKGDDPINAGRCYIDLSNVVAREEAAVRL